MKRSVTGPIVLARLLTGVSPSRQERDHDLLLPLYALDLPLPLRRRRSHTGRLSAIFVLRLDTEWLDIGIGDVFVDQRLRWLPAVRGRHTTLTLDAAAVFLCRLRYLLPRLAGDIQDVGWLGADQYCWPIRGPLPAQRGPTSGVCGAADLAGG